MIQSVTFGDEFNIAGALVGKNTWDDWRILPTERPVFTPPEPKTIFINVPGGNGSLDMSESLTRYPVYNNRTGSFSFRVMNGHKPWAERYSEIMQHIHGKAMRVVLADDPDWFYYGRFSVDGWASGDTWSVITIGYNVGPFKWYRESSIDPWIWDPFNFDTGVIWEQTFSNISINSPSSWVAYIWPPVGTNVLDFFGHVPFSPTIHVTGANNLDIWFQNTFLGIDQTIRLTNGVNYLPDIIFYGQPSYTVRFRGVGTISFEFRVGRL